MPHPLADRSVQFIRVLCAETGDSTFPFQRLGTGVVLAFSGEYFLLTARHCFTNHNADPRRVRIPITLRDRRPWTVIEFTLPVPTPNMAPDEPYSDVALFHLDRAALQGCEFESHDFVSLIDPGPIEIGYPLFAFGFPDTLPGIDFEAEQIIADLRMIEGRYSGPSTSLGLHAFESSQLLTLEHSGFSGGAVTALDLSTVGRHLLVGLILRGGQTSGSFKFLGRDMILTLLQDVLPRLGHTGGPLPPPEE